MRLNGKSCAVHHAISNRTKQCPLCIAEKFYIICYPKAAILNERTELIISKCRQGDKYLIKDCKMSLLRYNEIYCQNSVTFTVDCGPQYGIRTKQICMKHLVS